MHSDHTPPRHRKPFDWLSASFAGIWIVFMFFPLKAVWIYQVSPWMRGLGTASVLAFVLIYFCAFGKPSWLPGNPAKNVALWMLLLCIPFIGMLFTAREFAFSCVTYLVALWVFLTDFWYGIRIALTTLAFMFIASYSLFPDSNHFSRLWMFTGSFFVILVAYLGKRDNDKKAILMRAQQAEEREAIAADVHDLLGHSLTVISLKAELAYKLLENEPDKAKEELKQISSLSRSCLAQVRSTVTRLRLPDLPAEISAAAISLEAAGIKADLPSPLHIEQATSTNAPLFAAIVREAVTNVIRHSRATMCSINVEPERIEIRDNGLGFHPETSYRQTSTTSSQTSPSSPPQISGSPYLHGSNGIAGMRSRVERAGGIFIIEPCSQGGGTRVLVSMNGDTSVRPAHIREGKDKNTPPSLSS